MYSIIVSIADLMKKWRFQRQFGTVGKGDGEFTQASGIAVLPNGDTAVINCRPCQDYFHRMLYFFNKDGTYKTTLKCDTASESGYIFFPRDVAVTSKGHLVVVDKSKFVKIYSSVGVFLYSFCTLLDEDPETKTITSRVATTPEDEIFIGDLERQVVTRHKEEDSWIPTKVTLPVKPVFLATNGEKNILVSGSQEPKVHILDEDGAALMTIDVVRMDRKVCVPQAMVCDKNGNIYISVMEYTREGKPHRWKVTSWCI